MNWKTIASSSGARQRQKGWKLLRARVRRHAADAALAIGLPRPLARRLRERGLRGRVVLCKQGILSVAAGDVFLRYASQAKAAGKLEKERAGWACLKDAGLARILPRSMRVHPARPGVILETELLLPIQPAEQAAMTRPILEALVAAARPVVHGELPPGIAEGLALARVHGRLAGELEEAAHDAFARPVLTGCSHDDLHLRNVMKDGEARPVLIDLKSCAPERVLSLDVLNFACQYGVWRDGRNVIDQALDASRRGWELPGLGPILDLVDLPRPLWGALFGLDALGRVALKHGADRASLAAAVVRKIEASFRDFSRAAER